MASETLEEKKSEEEAPVKDKDDSKLGQPQGTSKEEDKEEKHEVDEEKENHDTEVKDAEEEDKDAVAEEDREEDAEEDEEQEEEDDEEEETPSKSKGGGRSSSSRKRKDSSEKQKEPVTPSSERPTRERKMVERYSAPEPGRSVAKPLEIQKGRGTQLKDIPNVAFKLSKRKPDDNLQMLHMILFGKKAKVHNLKKNIGQFSGFVWVENEEKQKGKIKEKFDKCVKEKLVDFCDVLNIPINKAVVKKEELTVKLLEFLESPHATTDVLLADKEQKGKKRKGSSGKNISPGEDSATPAKKRKRSSQSGEKRKRSSKVDVDEDEDEDKDKIDSPEAKDFKDDSQDNESDVEKEESDKEEVKSEEEEDESKEPPSTKKASKKTSKETSASKKKEKVTPAKKETPKSVIAPSKSAKKSSDSSAKKDTDVTPKSKGSASKKQKIEKGSPKEQSTPSKDKGTGKKQSSKLPAKASAKDQGKGKSSKKAKAEPTREEMHAVVVDILKEVDFNTATLSDILRQLGTHFGADLMHRKAEVKDIITEVINNMSDEEDDGEEVEDNAEAGDGADKDDDDD